jgi:HTH-type transcriptional regulator/antitoxin HigA
MVLVLSGFALRSMSGVGFRKGWTCGGRWTVLPEQIRHARYDAESAPGVHSQAPGRSGTAGRLVAAGEATALDEYCRRGQRGAVYGVPYRREQVPAGHRRQVCERRHAELQQGGWEAMSAAQVEIDPKRYGRLLARALPAVIRSEEENRRFTAQLPALDDRYVQLSPEERELADLITVLIEAFEEKHYALRASSLHSRLRTLMQEHGLRQRDLVKVFGSPRAAPEAVRGRRAINEAEAAALGRVFHVPADVFL